MAALESLILTLGSFQTPVLRDRAMGRLKAALANPEAELLKVIIKHVGRLMVTLTYAALEQDLELAVMLQTLLLVTSQTLVEEETTHLAQNFPALVTVYGSANFVAELLPLAEMLGNLPATHRAKLTFAASFHEARSA